MFVVVLSGYGVHIFIEADIDISLPFNKKSMKCPRISPEELERQRRSLGSMFFRQEFNCEFVETTDQVFGYDMVQSAFNENIKPLF